MSSANKAIEMMLSKKSKESRKDEIKIKYTDVHNLVPSEDNMYPITDIEKLACFIKMSGDITPLTLKPREDGKFTIISGHRRTQAVLYLISQDSNFNPMVPYCEPKNSEMLDFLDENDRNILAICLPNEGQRRELTAAERADVLKKLRPVVKKIYDQGNVDTHFRKFFADFLDMSESQIQRAEAYSKLSDSLKAEVDDGIIAPSVAALLIGMQPDEQDNLVRQIRDAGLKVTKQTVNDFLHPSEESEDDITPEEDTAPAPAEQAASSPEASEDVVSDTTDIESETSNEYISEPIEEENHNIEEASIVESDNIVDNHDVSSEALLSEPMNDDVHEEEIDNSKIYSEQDSDINDSGEAGEAVIDENILDVDSSTGENETLESSNSHAEIPTSDIEDRLNTSSDSKMVKEYKENIANYFDILTTVHSKSDLVDYLEMLRDEFDKLRNDLI